MTEQDTLTISPENKIKINAIMQKMFDDGASDSVIKEVRSRMLKAYGIPKPAATPTSDPTSAEELWKKSSGKYKEVFFPRTSKSISEDVNNTNNDAVESNLVNEANASLKNLNAFKSDLLSLPGRTIASLPETGWNALKSVGNSGLNLIRENDIPSNFGKIGKTQREGMKDTKGSNWAGKIVRSPATGAAIAAAIPTMGGSLIPSIGASALAGAGEQQLENLNQDKDLSGKQFGLETGFGIIGGGFGVGAGKLASLGLSKANKYLAKKSIDWAVNKLIKEIRPSGKAIANGFKKNVLVENEIIGTPAEALKKTESIIDENMTNIKETLNPVYASDAGIKGSMNPKVSRVEPTVDVSELINNMASSPKLTKGFLKEQKAALDDLHSRLYEIAPDGKVKLTDVPLVKNIIAELRNDFNNPPASEADKILGLIYRDIDKEFINVADNATGKGAFIKESNKKVSELIPIASMLKTKINQGIEEKIPGIISKVVGGTLSTGNVVKEILSNAILPGSTGAPTTMQAINEVSGYYIPKTANMFIKNAKADELIAKYNVFKSMNQNAPIPKKLILQKLLNKDGNARFTDADYRETMELMQGYKAQKAAERARNRQGTFGNIAGQGATREY